MTFEKQEIEFYESMNVDKRADGFCYLREGCFDAKTEGLYPATNFEREHSESYFPAGSEIKAIIDGLLFLQDGADLVVYKNTTTTTPDILYTLTGETFSSAVLGDDYVHLLTESGNNYKTDLSTTFSGGYNYLLINTFTSANSYSIMIFDGLYYWYFFDEEMYKQLKDGTPTLAFNDTGGNPKAIDVFGDQLAFFFSKGRDTIVTLWDKSDLDFFQKRITKKNARFLGGGNVDGTLILVTSIGTRANSKEQYGEIEVSGYDGEKFSYLNSIKAGDESISFTAQAVGSDVLYVSIDDNDAGDDNEYQSNPTIYQNWVLRVKKNGAIDTIYKTSDADDEVSAINIHYDYITIACTGDIYPLYRYNIDGDSDYGDYNDFDFDSRHVTNFEREIRVRHSLKGIAVSFEKLFDNGSSEEELEIYFRTSEREEFVLIGVINSEKVKDYINNRKSQTEKDNEYNDDELGLSEQVYIITKMPDGTALPEFNERQWDFRSKHGFSIVQAWEYYSYLTRNTMG